MTAAEIRTKMSEVEDAIDAAVLGQSYQMTTGQGSIQVSRQTLPALRKYYSELERRLTRLETDGSPTSAEVRH